MILQNEFDLSKWGLQLSLVEIYSFKVLSQKFCVLIQLRQQNHKRYFCYNCIYEKNINPDSIPHLKGLPIYYIPPISNYFNCIWFLHCLLSQFSTKSYLKLMFCVFILYFALTIFNNFDSSTYLKIAKIERRS